MISFKYSHPYYQMEDSILPIRKELLFEIFNCFLDKDEIFLLSSPIKATDQEYMKFIEKRKVLTGSIDAWSWWPKFPQKVIWFRPNNKLEILQDMAWDSKNNEER